MNHPMDLEDVPSDHREAVRRLAGAFHALGIDDGIRSLLIMAGDTAENLKFYEFAKPRRLVPPGSSLALELAICDVLGILVFGTFAHGTALFFPGVNLPSTAAFESLFSMTIPKTAAVFDDAQTRH